jgi:hypothetical protein
MQAALRIAEHLGLPKTFPNVRTIELAVECEAEFTDLPIEEAEQLIVAAAAHTRISINRFFFEDARWRETELYLNYQRRRRMEHTA